MSSRGICLPRWMAVFGVLAVLLPTIARADGMVELRSVARLIEGRPVLLKDVAELSGADALALADVVMLEHAAVGRAAGARWVELSISDVQSRLRAHDPAALARVVLRGRACAVIEVVASTPVERAAPAPEPGYVRSAPGTIGDLIERTIAETLLVPLSDVRCVFSPADRELVTRPVGTWSMDIRVCGSSSRLPLAIKAFDGELLMHDATIRVDVQVRRDVVVSAAPAGRGQVVSQGAFAITEQWLAPSVRPVAPTQAFGQELRTAVNAGAVIEERHLVPPLVIARGDRVVVHVASGTVLIEEHARALQAGRLGDVIDLEPLDGSRRRLRARVQGPGRAAIASIKEEQQ
ncbi:MAG: flagellar basal body P-ring formation protein FlgA [Phycisphaeraceae bacterium]|nr:flagellar basal body P-ring formation protein FlgA [Phycisphaeraceae bacterium]MCW5754622.1 flagellar basal body P-ring formation protein FlgA [Phycisphaeraceae bacterium]